MDHPVTVEAYTLPEAADALGVTQITFKKWIQDDLLPEPILTDTVRGYRHYSVGELTVIATVLQEHRREFMHYTERHQVTRERIMQSVHAWRARYI